MYQYLASLGYAGSLADKTNAYYADMLVNGGQPDLPAVGEILPDREQWVSASANLNSSGSVIFIYFTAKRNEAINTLTMYAGSTPAAATPTLCRLGVYSVASNGDLTLQASTPNDTTLFAAANTVYPKNLSSTWSKQAGQRYALAVLVVSATTLPTFCGPAGLTIAAALMAQNPALCTRLAGQTDLPSNVSAGSLVGHSFRPGFVIS